MNEETQDTAFRKMALKTAAKHLKSIEMNTAAASLERLAASSLDKYVDEAIEIGLADEKEKLQLEMKIKLMRKRLEMKMEYEVSYALRGSGLAAYNSQGRLTTW